MATEFNDAVENGVHSFTGEEHYVWPTEQNLLDKIEWVRDQKLGFMTHFGMYSQIGVIESWPLSDDDKSWSRAQIDWIDDAAQFKKEYFNLNKSFNPIRLQPDVLAKTLSKAGFKYITLTSKHHDGFCLFDTKYTDYKSTSPDCPFSTHKYANVVKSVWDACRAEGMGIFAYFSKPDWHNVDFWEEDKKYGDVTRYPTYKAQDKPEKWERFVQFTQNQLMELVGDYGKIDMLWLDGGWVGKAHGYDIRMEEIAQKARKIIPNLLIADRTMGGPYENIVTPEQTVPEKALNIPWESCITMGTGFSFTYDDDYKSVREIINILIDVVCKGGNLALNVALQPDGRMPRIALERIEGMGKYMAKYGEAIYATRAVAPYKVDNVAFTKKGDNVFSFVMSEQNIKDGNVFIPYEGKVTKAQVIGGSDVSFEKTNGGYLVKDVAKYIDDDFISLVIKFN